LNGKTYDLYINNGPNHLHGGKEGFDKKIWRAEEQEDGLHLFYISPDGEENYPGTLEVEVCYYLDEEDALHISYLAKADQDTVVNLTNHAYFNLNGEGNGDILGHTLKLNASEYLPTSESLIPLGESVPVAGTPMDFVNEKPLGQDIKEDFPALKYGKGYDNCWVIDGYEPGQLQSCAELYSPESGRYMEVLTTQPGVQVYTGNWLSGCPEGKNGHIYQDYSGVAIECQNYPDAPNKEDYPSAVLRPGEVYEQAIIFAFGIRK
jgi:aldose 1-epimerase